MDAPHNHSTNGDTNMDEPNMMGSLGRHGIETAIQPNVGVDRDLGYIAVAQTYGLMEVGAASVILLSVDYDWIVDRACEWLADMHGGTIGENGNVKVAVESPDVVIVRSDLGPCTVWILNAN